MEPIVYGLLCFFILGLDVILIFVSNTGFLTVRLKYPLLVLFVFAFVLNAGMALQSFDVAGQQYILMAWIFGALAAFIAFLSVKTLFLHDEVISLDYL